MSCSFCFMAVYTNSHVLLACTQVYQMGVYFCHRLKFYIVLFVFPDLLFLCVCFMCCHKWFPKNSQARAEELINE